jgi:hypothetical protein
MSRGNCAGRAPAEWHGAMHCAAVPASRRMKATTSRNLANANEPNHIPVAGRRRMKATTSRRLAHASEPNHVSVAGPRRMNAIWATCQAHAKSKTNPSQTTSRAETRTSHRAVGVVLLARGGCRDEKRGR